MGSLNKAQLIGNLGRDAELRYTPAGAPVASFSIATTEVWNDKQSGQKKEKTEWHRVVLWGKQAETVSEYLTKGKQVYVEGKIQTRKWQDRDGNDKYTTEINAFTVTLLGGGAGRGGARRGSAASDTGGGDEIEGDPVGDPIGEPITDDDIPF